MAGGGVHGAQLAFVLLLLLLIAFAAASRRAGVRYPIVLVVTGLLVSLVPTAR